MKIKRLISLFIFLFLLSACGSKVDDEALENIANSLEKRWEFTDDLPEEITEKDLERATQIELNLLKKYTAEDFKDPHLFVLYDDYIRILNDMRDIAQTMNIEDPEMLLHWHENIEKRAKILSDIKNEYGIPVSEDNLTTLDEVLEDSKRLLEAEKIEKSLQNINENINVLIEDESVLIEFPVESVLSVNSFVGHKTGFPGTAMEILNTLKEYDHQNIVIASVNQNTIAISAYFNKETLREIDFSEWEKINGYDGYKFYALTNDFYIRLGILNQISSDYYNHISKIKKNSDNDFWKKHGFTHDL